MPKFKPLPPLARVKELLRYDVKSGKLFWIQSVAQCIKIGDEAGSEEKNGIRVNLDKTKYLAHRVIWLLMTGQDPGDNLIDHIDGNCYNNRFSNLRLANRYQNGCNRKKHSNNTSGLKGVSWHKTLKKWQAYITVNSERICLGYFKAKEEAYAAYCEAARRLHGEFARFD
jgi:hypothetical protein